ncbi:MAG TPA: flagellar hook-length control protein FliK [Candidatus Competibacteraceae bacterium]|nr:flagellar hook-length control protein FliK [Candidatus Competibacteraceae bacterium]HRY19610.1 flagellar hook-length control protein FliK [Candidatus Competibacteraceae bacterium]
MAPAIAAATINDQIAITNPDHLAAIQQALPLAKEQYFQRRPLLAKPFTETFAGTEIEQPAQDLRTLATTISEGSTRIQRIAPALTNGPAPETAERTISSKNDHLPSFEANQRLSSNAVVSSAALEQRAVLANPANAPVAEPNIPASGTSTPTSVPPAAPARTADTLTSSAVLPTPQETLDLRQDNWGRVLGHQLSWLVNNRLQQAQIRVNPPQLGPLEIRMSLHQNQTNVTFLCHDAVVREAIESTIPRLREMLDSQGVSLNQAQVSDQPLARQQTGSGEQSAHNPRDGRPSIPTLSGPEPSSDESESRSPRLPPGIVDDYA